MVPTTTDRLTDAPDDTAVDEARSGEMLRRKQMVFDLWHRYAGVVRQSNAGYAGTTGLGGTESWLKKMKLTDDRANLDSIVHREEFFQKWGREIIEQGMPLKAQFDSMLREATPYISAASKERWLERFKKNTVGFQEKKYWVKNQFPYYIQNWKKTAEEREQLLKDPSFKLIGPKQFDVSKIKDKNAFLNMHYDERAGLLAKARAAILAQKSGKGDLYDRAKSMLNKAASAKVMSASNVGTWLERIFKSNADRSKIEAFLMGGANTDLAGLIANWADVKGKFDRIVEKVKRRGSNRAHGLYIPTESQFLGMHYAQRKACIEKLEDQLGSANDIYKDPPEFLAIRHALDLRDWEEADDQIRKAEKMDDLSPSQKSKLQSMKRYLTQFRTDVQQKQATEKKKGPGEAAKEAKNKIDSIMAEIPSSIKPTVLKLLSGPHANRSIHQLRWIVYNNKWCRDHNYLNRNKARKGASKVNRDLTEARGDAGVDIGIHDVQDEVTAGKKYIRKDNMANHKPTLRHVDTTSKGAMRGLEEWLEHEQNPRVLYWTTFCGHENGEPMSENWHNDLFFNLTELRSASRTLQNAGFAYGGEGRGLIGLN